ncbi:S41 family peptidase [Novosphingobium sp. KACC 22771]|uniref:S41 family peptidase n=1 Tax=Novosphingobium sp. KACC 22771 TaxID=3025670 RepID=UPI0023660FCE|nr:S41 family peptidase [Novosphingobium sp. KACC 22771]WDF70955.1 S41 family peptidase [Novosphingobium sp. KACC 22771]
MKTALRPTFRLIVLLALLSAAPAAAQPSSADLPDGTSGAPRLTPSARKATVVALARRLRSDYVFPDTANLLADTLTAKLAHGGYDKALTVTAMADALTRDLREIGKDAHLGGRFAPDQTDDKSADPAQERRAMARMGFGINAVQRLPGNIGYLDVRGFGPTPLVAEAYAAAMSLLSGTDALIVDMRRNGGGEPQSVTELASYFFAKDDVRHLNDLYSRTDGRTVEYRTNPDVAVHYAGPIFVLTSRFTFSGGEEFAYDLQTQKRATLIGEVTGGGANPGDFVPLPNGFAAFIPTGRAINPVTKANWEHVGVQPDLVTPASEGMKIAYTASLKALVARADSPRQRETLSAWIASAEKGEVQLPTYTPPTR